MKKLLSVMICTAIILCAFSGCKKVQPYSFEKNQQEGAVSVVSFNCAAPWGSAVKGTSSSSRVKRFAQYMNDVRPDSIGTQEMNSSWLEKLSELMPDYDSYGVKRGGDDSEKKSEMNAVFWLRDKYDCIDKATFWLSETPEQVSRYSGAGCHRVCTYVVLQDKTTGDKYIHMNTHLDNKSDEAREYGAGVIMDRVEELILQYPGTALILTGDFNDTVGSLPYNLITQTLSDSFDTLGAEPQERKSTYTDWGSLEDDKMPIDFIFTNTASLDYRVLDDTANGLVSDHYGVYSVISLS